MAITDPALIKYSNEHFRVGADRQYTAYQRIKQLNQLWEAAQGDDDAKAAAVQLGDNILRVAADALMDCYFFNHRANRIFSADNLTYTNSSAELIYDNSDRTAQDPNRPPIDGQDVVRLKNRMEEIQSWLERGTNLDTQFLQEGDVGLATVTYDFMQDALRCSSAGSKTPTTAWAKQLASDLATDLLTEYEVTNPGFPSHILRVAVNPFEFE